MMGSRLIVISFLPLSSCFALGDICLWKSVSGWKSAFWICSTIAGNHCLLRPTFREFHASFAPLSLTDPLEDRSLRIDKNLPWPGSRRESELTAVADFFGTQARATA